MQMQLYEHIKSKTFAYGVPVGELNDNVNISIDVALNHIVQLVKKRKIKKTLIVEKMWTRVS